MLLLFGIEEKRGWLPFTGMSGGGGGFGVDDEEEDEVNEEWTKLELGTGKPGLGEAPVLLLECGLLPGTAPVRGDWLLE